MSDLDAYLSADLLEQLGDAVTVIDVDWVYRFVSEQAVRIIGRPREEILGHKVWDIFPEVVGTPQHEACVRAMTERTRERVVWYFDTVGRWYEQYAIPAGDGLVVLVNDISERLAADERAGHLVVVGEAMAGAATYQQVSDALTQRVLPLINAQGGTIVLADSEHHVMRSVDWSGLDASLQDTWSEFSMDVAAPSTEAYRTGQIVTVRGYEESRERYPLIAPELERMGQPTIVAIPLTSGGTRLGALIVGFAAERELGLGDEYFLTTTAAMTAQALVRAGLLQAERRSIAALQRSLLPPVLPDLPGIDVVARYSASDATTEVGGDWYDVVPLPGGAVGLVMGDVEGHDLGAAALMGLVRSAVRAYALEGHPPAIVLARANTFLASLNRGRIVTLAYSQLHPVERLITTVSAGHPGTQVAGQAGESFEIPSEVGPPLGVFTEGLLWPETTSTLPELSVFAMFTDGLIERRGEDIDVGIERVRRILMEHVDAGTGQIADVLLESVIESADDVALVVGRLLRTPDPGRRLTRRLPPTPASVFLARRFVTQLLVAWEVAEPVVEAAELVLSELATNAARHSEDFFEVRLSCTEDVLRLEVEDTSHRMPSEVPGADDVAQEATGGRGLLLVDAVSSRWGVESEGLSKVVWAEFDLGA